MASPGRRTWLLLGICFGIFGHPIERLAFSKDSKGIIGNSNISSGHAKGIVTYSTEDEIIFLALYYLNLGRLLMITPIVPNPSVPKNLMPKALFVFLATILEVEF